METQKRVVAIHDISGFGKCSLTVALPILSAAGLEACAIPTAVLSTHTGGFEGYTYRDLTDDVPAITNHWKSLDLNFDAVYSGYLGSARQIDMVKQFFDTFDTDTLLKVVDPAMADNGKMYVGFEEGFSSLMRNLCAKADIIIPNITEAAIMTGNEYQSIPQTEAYIEKLMHDLCQIGAKQVVLTGVSFEKGKLGIAYCEDTTEGKIDYVFAPHLSGMYHGTGDVFSSVFLSAYLNNKSMKESIRIAAEFVGLSIHRMLVSQTKNVYGVEFEKVLPWMIGELGSYPYKESN